MWIGLHAQSGETSWEWANYEPVTYTNWDRREPNNAGDEDCAIMYYSVSSYQSEFSLLSKLDNLLQMN